MKKIISVFLLLLVAFPTQNVFAVSVTDSGAYKSGQSKQENADNETRDQKQDSQTQTSFKNTLLGGIEDFTNGTLDLLGLQKTSEGVNNSLSEEGKGASDKIPEGISGSNFFQETLLPPAKSNNENSEDDDDDETETGVDAAGITETSEAKEKRERALVEVATFGYALAAVHKTQAARNLDGKSSIDKRTTEQTNTTKNYSSTVSNNTSVKMSTAQIYNAVILTSATNNMLTAISSADYVTHTNSTLKDMLGSMFFTAIGGMAGSWLD